MARGVDDVALREPLLRGGWRCSFVPSVLNVDTEAAAPLFPNTLNFLCRQNLWTRIHHSQWAATQVHGFLNGLLPLSAVCTAAALVVAGEVAWAALGVVAAASAAHFVSGALLIAISHANVMRCVAAHGRDIPCSPARVLVASLLYVPVTSVMQIGITAWVCTVRRVVWRGVHYSVTHGPVPLLRITHDEQDHARAAAKLSRGRSHSATVDVHAEGTKYL